MAKNNKKIWILIAVVAVFAFFIIGNPTSQSITGTPQLSNTCEYYQSTDLEDINMKQQSCSLSWSCTKVVQFEGYYFYRCLI